MGEGAREGRERHAGTGAGRLFEEIFAPAAVVAWSSPQFINRCDKILVPFPPRQSALPGLRAAMISQWYQVFVVVFIWVCGNILWGKMDFRYAIIAVFIVQLIKGVEKMIVEQKQEAEAEAKRKKEAEEAEAKRKAEAEAKQKAAREQVDAALARKLQQEEEEPLLRFSL